MGSSEETQECFPAPSPLRLMGSDLPKPFLTVPCWTRKDFGAVSPGSTLPPVSVLPPALKPFLCSALPFPSLQAFVLASRRTKSIPAVPFGTAGSRTLKHSRLLLVLSHRALMPPLRSSPLLDVHAPHRDGEAGSSVPGLILDQ